MPTRELKTKVDGQTNFLGGSDYGRSPILLADNQVGLASNVTCRGGFADQRPGWFQLPLTFADADTYAYFTDYNYQGRGVYVYRNRSYPIFAIGGKIFRVNPYKDWLVTDITPADCHFSSDRTRVWMEQADIYFIIQDGLAAAVILEGNSARLALHDGNTFEVPTGTVMCFNESIGRLCVAVGNEIAIGDIKTPTTRVIDFTEERFLAEGGRFKIPQKYGPITAMQNVIVLDRSTGMGPMQVATFNSLTSLNLPPDREQWKNLSQPLQTISLYGYGSTSQDSCVPVNGDLLYRATDGMRSFRVARNDFDTWGNVPISTELNYLISADPQKALGDASAVLFDNRLIFTINPYLNAKKAIWNGVAALNFDLVSKLGAKLPPVYEGAWGGIKVWTVLKATINDEERCFVLSQNDDDKNELWELSKENEFDGEDGRITSFIQTRAFNFQNPLELKKLKSLELFVDKLKGSVDFSVYWRPDAYSCWFLWKQWTECQTFRQCSITPGDCTDLAAYRSGERTRMKLGEPPITNVKSEDKPANLFYTVELRIEWVGRARLKQFILKAYGDQDEIGDFKC